jgi:hypothetical protein
MSYLVCWALILRVVFTKVLFADHHRICTDDLGRKILFLLWSNNCGRTCFQYRIYPRISTQMIELRHFCLLLPLLQEFRILQLFNWNQDYRRMLIRSFLVDLYRIRQNQNRDALTLFLQILTRSLLRLTLKERFRRMLVCFRTVIPFSWVSWVKDVLYLIYSF